LGVFPQNIELNTSNRDLPDKLAIRHFITQPVDIDVYLFLSVFGMNPAFSLYGGK
jgi:hypothetical protein